MSSSRMNAKDKAIFEKACRIYAAMPGAVQPPQMEFRGQPGCNLDDKAVARLEWAAVENTPEFKFCTAIAREITDSALAAIATSIEAAVSVALVEFSQCMKAASDACADCEAMQDTPDVLN